MLTFLFRNLSDLDKDGQLNIEEFALAMHFVEIAKVGKTLPPAVPPELLPPSYQSRQTSLNNFPPAQDGRERSDSARERSGSERERSGSMDGKPRSGSSTVCKSHFFVPKYIRWFFKSPGCRLAWVRSR